MADNNSELKDTTPFEKDGKVYAYCPDCQKITEQCQYYAHNSIYRNRCIECNDGPGYSNECNNCYHDQNSDDD